MKSLLFSVVYPGLTDEILADYVASIKSQTDPAFDWLMINDGADASQKTVFGSGPIWIDVRPGLSFGEIREIAIAYARANGYEALIFSDVDDYYSHNRVAVTKDGLRAADFVFTELQVVGVNKELLHRDLLKTLTIPRQPSSVNDVLHYNFVGLSHSAVRVDALRRVYIPSNIEVVDWWLYSILLLHGCNGLMLPSADTFYRQNDRNYVGVYNALTPDRLARGIAAKMRHYGALAEHCTMERMDQYATLFLDMRQQMAMLRDATRHEAFRDAYIRAINTNFRSLYHGWWSEILSLDAWRQYAE